VCKVKLSIHYRNIKIYAIIVLNWKYAQLRKAAPPAQPKPDWRESFCMCGIARQGQNLDRKQEGSTYEILNVHFHYMNVCALINVGLLLAAGAKSLCLRHKVTKSQVKKKLLPALLWQLLAGGGCHRHSRQCRPAFLTGPRS
jgi:hypothetical protein